jgi:hypothetical protein
MAFMIGVWSEFRKFSTPQFRRPGSASGLFRSRESGMEVLRVVPAVVEEIVKSPPSSFPHSRMPAGPTPEPAPVR